MLVSSCGIKDIVYYFGLKGSHYFTYEFGPPSIIQINQDARPEIIDAPLTLVFRIGQGVCFFGF